MNNFNDDTLLYKYPKTKKLGRVVSRLLWGATFLGQYFYIVLTTDMKLNNNTMDLILTDWSLLRKRMRRKYKGEFCWVLGEGRHTGMLHLNILWRGEKIDWQWLSESWKLCHGAKKIYIKEVNKRDRSLNAQKNLFFLRDYIQKQAIGISKTTQRTWGMSRSWIANPEWKRIMKKMVRLFSYPYFISKVGHWQFITCIRDNVPLEYWVQKLKDIDTMTYAKEGMCWLCFKGYDITLHDPSGHCPIRGTDCTWGVVVVEPNLDGSLYFSLATDIIPPKDIHISL